MNITQNLNRPKFSARYSASQNQNPNAKRAVSLGLLTMGLGGASIGSGIAHAVNGDAMPLQLSLGGLNMYSGYDAVQKNGGLDRLKDPK